MLPSNLSMVYFDKYNSEIRINAYCVGQSSLRHWDMYYLFAPIIQNDVAFPFSLLWLPFQVFCTTLAKGVQLSLQVKPLDLGWRGCVNVLPVWRLSESNFLPFHNFCHQESHLRVWRSLGGLGRKMTEAREQGNCFCPGLPGPSPLLCCQRFMICLLRSWVFRCRNSVPLM